MVVLGVDVNPNLLALWQRWLAPEIQPFFVESLRSWPKSGLTGDLSAELRDTYKVWKLDRSLKTLWLDEESFFALPRAERARLVRSQVAHGRGAVPTVRQWADLIDPVTLRSQADGHRFVWWPRLITRCPEAILLRTVATGELPSRHREVPSHTWDRCAVLLPGARSLAGSFAESSGPNCFGTVMATAGVDGAARQRVVQKPFLAWLHSVCRPGGSDDDPGTVLMWRNRDGLPVHAAVTIGDGWALEKPSQSWSAPRVVLGVDELIRVNRLPGNRLERHRISAAASRR